MVWEISNFGSVEIRGKGRKVKQFSWRNVNGLEVQVLTYGATIRTIRVPDKDGRFEDIVTGFDNIEGYTGPTNRYFGATVGRAANRLYKGLLKLNGSTYQLATNLPSGNHLHGGDVGFDKAVWEDFVDGKKLILSYHSGDLEEGYPGDLVVQTTYQLTDDNKLLVDFKAITTKPTFINLTNHSYFNLAGHAAGAEEIYKHLISINADHVTEVQDAIPTGNLEAVSGTVFDLRVPVTLGDVINKVPNHGGYDHNYCINKSSEESISFVASALHPGSGRLMEIYGNQPGLQFYTSNFLPDIPVGLAKEGRRNYVKHGAFCFEPQKYPDAPNHSNFPSAILNPGEEYNHHIVYKFLTKNS